jgi:TonB family protein
LRRGANRGELRALAMRKRSRAGVASSSSRRAAALAISAAVAIVSGTAQAQFLAPAGQDTPQAITPPRLAIDSPAVYPQAALDAHFHDAVTVVLVLDVDATGAVTRARVDTPAGHGFDEAAVAAASKLGFQPATQGDKAIAARIHFRYVFRPPPPRLSGRCASRVTDAPLAGARVTVMGADGRERTTTTAADGTWSLAGLPPGKIHVGVTAAGRVAEALDEDLEPGQETRVVIRLAAEAAPAPVVTGPAGGPPALEVEVKGERPPREVSKRTLDKSEIALIPGTNGDALKSLLSLPGVARPPPLSGNLAVRGSAPGDTPVFVGGTGIPILYHFGGLSSVVPTEVLEKIDFYPGNYSAMYGRGTGGVVDVGIREPKKDGIHGFAQLDLIDARLLAEGPIGGGFSFMVAGRRSWFDLWLAPILAKTGADVTTAPRYYDYQALVSKDIDAHSSFRLMFFGSDDAIDILQATASGSNPASSGSFSEHTAFWRLQARYQNRVDARTEIKAVAAVGQDIMDLGAGTTFSNTTTTPVSARVELSEKVMRGVVANTGVDFAWVPYQLNINRPPPRAPGVASNGPGDLPLTTSDSGSSVLPALYTEWEFSPWVGTRIVPGLRADYASPSKTWDISPRLTLRQDLTREFPRTVVKGGIGLFYEPPQPIQIDPVFGTPGLLDSRAIQVDGGFEQEFTPQLGLSVDVFYKSLDRLIVQKQGNIGTGQAYGSEFLLRYKADARFFGWLSYTISRSERRDGPTAPTYLFQYDQPHIFTILGSYLLGRGWRVGARFQLTSGSLYTPNAQGAYDATVGVNLPVAASPQFGTRTPIFHQLDVRVDKVWKFSRWQLTWYLDIQNVYNYQAPEGQTYNYNYTQSAFVKGLPILPSIGLRGEL